MLATTLRLTGDFDLSEEAVQDAFVAALEHWPREGAPANPYAWLVSTARFKAIVDRIAAYHRDAWATNAEASTAAASGAVVHAIGLVIMAATKRLRLLRQDGDRTNSRMVGNGTVETLNERAIDLESVEWQLLQVVEGREACAEVVDGNTDAQIAQLLQFTGCSSQV